MNNDIYATPEAEITNDTNDETLELASRRQRLGAAFADGMLQLLILLPVMYFTIGFEVFRAGAEQSLLQIIGLGLLGLVIFLLLQGKLLVTKGQTLGKRSAKIKIVDLQGNLPTVKGHLLKRYGFNILIQHIPVIGPIILLISIFLVFGKTRRCGHDYIAGTKVIKC